MKSKGITQKVLIILVQRAGGKRCWRRSSKYVFCATSHGSLQKQIRDKCINVKPITFYRVNIGTKDLSVFGLIEKPIIQATNRI